VKELSPDQQFVTVGWRLKMRLQESDVEERIRLQEPHWEPGRPVTCASCRELTRLERVGPAFRCEHCRSAITRAGERYHGQSVLMPSGLKTIKNQASY